MPLRGRIRARICALGLLLGCLAAASWAQTYPARPVKIVVGYPAGGASDVAARLVAARLSERLGQSFVVENRPGSAGNLGADAVAKAKPDGHTLLLGTISLSINPSLYPKLSYDPLKDFTSVALFASTPFLLVVHPASPYRTAQDLLEAARSGKASIDYATAGNGSGSHLFTELLSSTAGVRLNHVPYKGAAPAMNEVLAQQVPMTFDNVSTTLPLVRSGKLRALGVSTRKRSRVAPDIPTLDESGVPGFDATAWFGLLAPTGTPADIVRRLNQEVNEVVKEPAITEKLLQLGAEPVTATPEAFGTFFRSEVARWERVVRDARVTVD